MLVYNVRLLGDSMQGEWRELAHLETKASGPAVRSNITTNFHDVGPVGPRMFTQIE